MTCHFISTINDVKQYVLCNVQGWFGYGSSCLKTQVCFEGTQRECKGTSGVCVTNDYLLHTTLTLTKADHTGSHPLYSLHL